MEEEKRKGRGEGESQSKIAGSAETSFSVRNTYGGPTMDYRVNKLQGATSQAAGACA